MPPRRKQHNAPVGNQEAEQGRQPATSGIPGQSSSFLQQLQGRMAMIRQAALEASPHGSSPSRPRPTPSLTPTLSSTPPSPPGLSHQCTPNSASTQCPRAHAAPQQSQACSTAVAAPPAVLSRRSASPPPPSQASPAQSSSAHSTPSPPLHACLGLQTNPDAPAAQAPTTPCAPMPTPASPPRPPLTSLAATASSPVLLLSSRERKRRLQDQQTAAALHGGAAPEPVPRKQARRAGNHSMLDGARAAVTQAPNGVVGAAQCNSTLHACNSPTNSATAPAVLTAPAVPSECPLLSTQGRVVDGGTLYPPGTANGPDAGPESMPAAAAAAPVPDTAAAGTANSMEQGVPTSPAPAQPLRHTVGHASLSQKHRRTSPDGTPRSGQLGSPASAAHSPTHHHPGSPASSVHTASTSSTPALNPRAVLWAPPVSPFSLLEEVLYEDPWKLLVACMLLNKTSSTQVRLILGRLFALYPTAESLAALHQPAPARTTTTTGTTKASRGRRAGSGRARKSGAPPREHAGSKSGSPPPSHVAPHAAVQAPDARGGTLKGPPGHTVAAAGAAGQPCSGPALTPACSQPPQPLHTAAPVVQPHNPLATPPTGAPRRHDPPPPAPGLITAHEATLQPAQQLGHGLPSPHGSPASVFTPTPSASLSASPLGSDAPPKSATSASSSLGPSTSLRAGHPASSPLSSNPQPLTTTQPARSHAPSDFPPQGPHPDTQGEGAPLPESLPAVAGAEGHAACTLGTPRVPDQAMGAAGDVTMTEACGPPSDPATALAQLQQLLRPLGLYRKRALMLARFSYEYLHMPWTDPRELHGIGDYAADAYWIFCRGRWHDIFPADKDLRRYKEWLLETGGEGAGLQRESLTDVLSAPPGASKTDNNK